MRKSKILSGLVLAPLLAQEPESKESLAVGGQAVMEGVMLRNCSRIAIAVRQPDGAIVVQGKPWQTLFKSAVFRKPYVRGFPLLIETMINGIKALNTSAELALKADGDELKPWQLAITLIVALLFAVFLFVVVPHLLTVLLGLLHISGGVEGFSFHLWDGLFKFGIFLLYILIIGSMPDIKRVFQYHGAEHKCIHAYENGANPITIEIAATQTRLHPRCGTTFLLFVLSIAILLHVLLLPLLLYVWTPSSALHKHGVVIVLKLLLMAPISALAYEAIRIAARIGDNLLGEVLRGPGMLLQLLTTREPDYQQLEVALVSLNEALKTGSSCNSVLIRTAPYTVLENS